MYQQNPNPTGSLFLSALLALIPLVAVLVPRGEPIPAQLRLCQKQGYDGLELP